MSSPHDFLINAIPIIMANRLGTEIVPRVFVGFVPGSTRGKTLKKENGKYVVNIQDTTPAAQVERECILIHQDGGNSPYLDTQIQESAIFEIEIRLPKGQVAADDILQGLEKAGVLIELLARYDEPHAGIETNAHSLVVRLPAVCPSQSV